MERTGGQRLARILRWLIITAFVCNLLGLLLVPGIAAYVIDEPFGRQNGISLKRAAVCCWIIASVAFLRTVIWLFLDKTIAPLFTYNTLFVPAFFMAGLLFLVMSALFDQAAELKEDQDLTI